MSAHNDFLSGSRRLQNDDTEYLITFNESRQAKLMQDVRKEISSSELSIDSDAEPSSSGNKQLIASDDDAIRVAPSILLVDDEPLNMMVLEMMLEELEFTVDKANNGAEAISMIEKRLELAIAQNSTVSMY